MNALVAPQSQSSANQSAPLIACIDDSKTVQRHLSLILQKAGYEVLSITAAPEAKAQLLAHPPAVILLDIVMPDVDGYELCRQLHRTPGLADIPIIMLTGQDNSLQRIRARGVGAIDFLVKPIEPAHLLERLGTLISQPQTRRPQPAVTAAPITTPRPQAFWDLASQRLGLTHRQRQNLLSTGQKLERALLRQPNRVDLWEKLGMVSYLLNHLPLAMTALNRVMQLAPDQHLQQRNLGWIAEEMGNLALAQEHYQAHLAHDPDDCYVQGRLKLLQQQP